MPKAQHLLVRCVESGDVGGLKTAVQAGALLDKLDKGGWSALHHAAANGNTEMVRLLLASSANPNSRSMEHGEEGATSLHLAACVGNTGVMKLLLDGGIDIEAVDQRGKTAVHWAALQGKLESLKVLQEYKCNLKAQVNGRGTALHYAAAHGDLEVVEWLVEEGLDITTKDKSGRVAKDVAKRNGHKHIHHYLKEQAKRQMRKSSMSKSRKHDPADDLYPPVPTPRQRTIFDTAKNTLWQEPVAKERGITRSFSLRSNSSNFSVKKGWTGRSVSVGNKGGLRLQLEEMKSQIEDMEEALKVKDVQIARLQGEIFATELEKVRVEEQLKVMRMYEYSGQWETSSERHKDITHLKETSSYDATDTPTQDNNALLVELEDVKAKLEEEKHARANERYMSDLKIASLTSELEETTRKLKKYGVRQKKLLHKNKTLETDFTITIIPSGLPDQGDGGALNSITQCLYSVASLRDHLTSNAYRYDVVSGGEAVEALAGVFKALKAGVQPEIHAKMNQLKGVISGMCDISGYVHGVPDAHNILGLLLPWLHRDLCHGKGSSVVSQLFFGSEEHSVTCRWTGQDVSRVAQDFSAIHLKVNKEKNTSIQSLLENHYQSVSIDEDCSHCLRSHLCRRQTSVTHLPPVLIIHIDRKEKKANVTFPPSHLMLQDVLKCEGPSYELFGVVTIQKKNSFRYNAFCRNLPDSTWYLHDDERVSEVSIRTVMEQQNTHLLFYSAERKEVLC